MSIFQLQRNQQQELTLVIDLTQTFEAAKKFLRRLMSEIVIQPILKTAQIIYYSLDYLTNHHAVLGLVMALGLGVGIGLTVFQNPAPSLAALLPQTTPTTRSQSASTPIRSVETEFFFQEVSPQAKNQLLQSDHQLYLQPFGQSRTNQTHFLKGNPSLYNYLKLMGLGDKIEVAYSNGSTDVYTIITISTVAKNQIQNLTDQYQTSLVIYASTGLLSDNYYCLVAKNN